MRYFFIVLQYLIPQHLLSRCIGHLANCKTPWLKSILINRFIKTYNVDIEEAENSDPESYDCFNDFFCRALKTEARPITADAGEILSPADGAFSQLGKIKSGRIFQAKGRDYSTAELLASSDYESVFDNGEFATIYLSPKDYHRLHMPVDGKLISMTHVPGDLFSVNPLTTESVPRLFARNERVVCIFETDYGPMALVLVGAMIVASIETIWAGLVAPAGKKVVTTDYQKPKSVRLNRGEEFARFKLGSTIIVLFPENKISWTKQLASGSSVRMGESIANTIPVE